MEEEKNATKEPFDTTPFAQLLLGPRGRQTGAIFLAFGIPGDHGHRMQGGVDPGDEAQTPIGGVQADDARADGIEAHSPFQQWTSKGSIMDIGAGEQVEDGQAGAAAEQGMHAIAT